MRVMQASMGTYHPATVSLKSKQQSFGACNGTSCSIGSGPSRGRKIVASAIGLMAGFGVLGGVLWAIFHP